MPFPRGFEAASTEPAGSLQSVKARMYLAGSLSFLQLQHQSSDLISCCTPLLLWIASVLEPCCSGGGELACYVQTKASRQFLPSPRNRANFLLLAAESCATMIEGVMQKSCRAGYICRLLSLKETSPAICTANWFIGLQLLQEFIAASRTNSLG